MHHEMMQHGSKWSPNGSNTDPKWYQHAPTSQPWPTQPRVAIDPQRSNEIAKRSQQVPKWSQTHLKRVTKGTKFGAQMEPQLSLIQKENKHVSSLRQHGQSMCPELGLAGFCLQITVWNVAQNTFNYCF